MNTQNPEKALPTRRGLEDKGSYNSEKLQTTATGRQPERNQTALVESTPSWLNDDGSSKSLDEIRSAAEQWKPADWESYLASTETYQREEYLKNGCEIEKLNNEDYTAALVEILNLEEYPALKNEVRKILDSLSRKHRCIIQMRYWENKTHEEIAKIVGMTRQGVNKALKSSQKRIESKLRIIAAKKSCVEVLNGASKDPT